MFSFGLIHCFLELHAKSYSCLRKRCGVGTLPIRLIFLLWAIVRIVLCNPVHYVTNLSTLKVDQGRKPTPCKSVFLLLKAIVTQ